MIIKLRQFIDRLIHFKKAPCVDDFGEIEVKLMKVRPQARSSFEQDLREKLRSRHQELCENRVEKESGFFYVHRFATSMALAVILVAGGGGLIVSATGSPIPKNMPIQNINPGWHPDVAPITIEFNKSMMRESVEEAFSIYPEVPGSFVWDDRHKMHFLPDNPLDPNQEYVVTISQNAKSIFQKPISVEFKQDFKVFSPELSPDITEKLTILKDLRENMRNATPEDKEEILTQIIALETELELFFGENKQPVQNPINPKNEPPNALPDGPKIVPSSA